MLASTLMFAGMGASVKFAAGEAPNAVVVFGRNAFGLLALLPWLRSGPARGLATQRPWTHVLRTVSGLAAMACFFYAIGRLRLADAVLLNFSLPLFIPVVAFVGLGERFPVRLWRVLGLGFVGLLLILKPTPGLFQPAAVVGLAAGMLGAVAQVTVRALTRTEPATRIVFYFGALGTAIASVPAALAWKSPSATLWMALMASGVFATLGQLLMTAAYARAPAGQVGPFLYATVVFAALLDWSLWGSLPDGLSALGAVIVGVAGGLALRWMPHQSKRA
jgi:drug/metabolite transporter (DMT)-like permease